MNPTPAAAPRGGFLRSMLRGTLIFLVAMSLLTAVLGLALWEGLTRWAEWSGQGVSITFNGQDVLRAVDLTSLPPAHKVVLVVVVALALLAAMLALPIALLAGAAAMVLVVLGAVALPLLIGFMTLAVFLAPLWLLAWWLFVRWRRSRANAPAGHARPLDA